MSNIVIVGSGPAGVSAALYAVRAGVQTTVLTKGSGALARAETIENYYGFAQPVSGPELERRSIENARRLGVQFVQTEAVGLTWTDRLTVETLAGAYPADAVILATGTFLKGKIFVGEYSEESGPDGMHPAAHLSDSLRSLGITLRRFKTGTPARVHGNSVDFTRLEEQHAGRGLLRHRSRHPAK